MKKTPAKKVETDTSETTEARLRRRISEIQTAKAKGTQQLQALMDQLNMMTGAINALQEELGALK